MAGDPYGAYARSVAPQPTAKELTTAQKEEQDAALRRAQLARMEQEYRRTAGTPLPTKPAPPKTASQQGAEAYQQRRASVLGESAAKTEFGLPKVEAAARRAMAEGTSLVKHPGFEAAVGMPNPFTGGFGVGNVGPAGDFVNSLEGAKGGAFLQAYEALKGAGAISEFESKSATNAIANMKASTTEEQFKRELQRYLDIVAGGVKVARQQSRMGQSPFTYDQLMAERQRRAAGNK